MAFEGLSEKLASTFKKLKNRGKLSETDVKEAMREVRLSLLEADVNYKVAKDFVASVSAKAIGDEVLSSMTPAQQVIKIVNEELTALMGSTNVRINLSSRIPTILLMCGLQGSGKTTHSAKLAYYFKQQGTRPLLVACDVYRPAAIE
ncbi:MAG: signal recognition particle receptor subunit alpha, partial [Angelakisella sp.]